MADEMKYMRQQKRKHFGLNKTLIYINPRTGINEFSTLTECSQRDSINIHKLRTEEMEQGTKHNSCKDFRKTEAGTGQL
jgi:hypothetical protein